MFSARLWRHGLFLRFFIGASLSTVGNWFNTVAVSVLVYQLTGQVATVAITITLSVLPRVLLGLIGGALADRFDRRNLLIAIDGARGLIALLPLLAHDAASVWLVYLAVFLLQTGGCVYSPTQSAYVAHLVSEDLLEPANAAYTSMRDIGMFIGPALAAVLLGAWGPAAAFWFNSLSFFVSAGLLSTLSRGGQAAGRTIRFSNLLAGYGVIVRRYPRIAALYLCYFGAAIPVYFFQAIMVAYARTLGQPTAFVGVFYAAAGLGGALGAICMGQFLRRLPYAAAVALYALCIPLLGMLALVHDVGLALPLLAGSSAAGTAGDVLFAVNVQRHVASEERGRAFALQFWSLPMGWLIGAILGIGTTLHTAVPTLLWVSAAVFPIMLVGAILSTRSGRPASATLTKTAMESVR